MPGHVALVAGLAMAALVGGCVTASGDGALVTAVPTPQTAADLSPASSPMATPVPADDPGAAGEPGAPVDPGAPADPGAAEVAVASTPVPAGDPPFGYISLDESQVFVRAVSRGIREAASAAGIELLQCDAAWTRDGVLDCADRLAAAGVVGVIGFQPFEDLAPEVCTRLGDVPVIGVIYDQGPCQASLLEIDQVESGRLAGAAMGRFALEQWDCDVRAYLSLGSGADDPIGGARMEGYRDGYQEHCELPGIDRSLVGAQYLVTAKTQVADQLARIRGKPILVAAVSDLAVLGAMEAAADAGRENHLWYSGQLAEPVIRQEIACNDRYIASVAQFPERFGSVVLPVLVDAVEGREVPPAIEAELQLVTAENVRQLFPDTPACDE